MPKSYEYNGVTFNAEALSALMGEEVVDTPAGDIDGLVNQRDAGASRILAGYRKQLGLTVKR